MSNGSLASFYPLGIPNTRVSILPPGGNGGILVISISQFFGSVISISQFFGSVISKVLFC